MALTAALRDLNKLNTFVRVAERGSFTKAAVDLSTRPSVISKRIKELEDSLGFSLLNRSTHGIVLTDAGEGLFKNFMEMLGKLDDYVVDARNLQTGAVGTLRVQTTDDFAKCVLTPLVVTFAGLHPSLRIHLSVLTDSSSSVDDGADVIIAGSKPNLPGLTQQDLGAVRYVICASPAYLRANGKPKSPQDIRHHNCLVNQYSGPKDWPFQTATRPLLIEPKGSMSSDNYAVLIQMALRNCGIIRVPRHAVKAELEAKELEAILERVALSTERVSAYFSKSKHLPAKTLEFVSYLRSAVSVG